MMCLRSSAGCNALGKYIEARQAGMSLQGAILSEDGTDDLD
jgi:hypothetical protein